MDNGYSEPIAQPSLLRTFILLTLKRKRLIITTFLSIVAAVGLLTFLLPAIYKSSATILINREIDTEKAILFKMNAPRGYERHNWILSEVEILKSYPVAETVVKGLLLHKLDLSPQDVAKKSEEVLIAETIQNFQEDLEIVNLSESNVIQISYEHKDPQLTAKVIDLVYQAYLQHRAAIFNENDSYRFLQEQLEITDSKLRELEKREANYRQQEDILSTETQGEILLTKLTDYEKNLTAVRTRRIGKEARLRVISDLSREGSVNIPTTETSDSPSREKYIAQLKGNLLDMEVKKNQLLQRFKPTYEGVIELENNIAAANQKIRAEIAQIIGEEKTSIRVFKAEEKELKKLIAKVNQQVKDFSQQEYQIQQLSRGINDSREVYSMLLKQREEARISLAKQDKDLKIKLISPAVVPVKPIRPKKVLNFIVAIILGITCAYGLAWFVEAKNYIMMEVEESGRVRLEPVKQIEGVVKRETESYENDN